MRCDADLAEALARDLDGHFERLVRSYQQRIYAFALRLAGGSPQDAEEIAQDAFIRAYRALARYPAERVRAMALRPWLYRIALNAARNRVRTYRPPMVSLDEEGVPEHAVRGADGRDDPAAHAERAERSDELAVLVKELPARYRSAVLLRHMAGLSYGEAAAVVGCPVGTVKSDVHRGVQLLRAAMVAREQAAARDTMTEHGAAQDTATKTATREERVSHDRTVRSRPGHAPADPRTARP